MVNKKKLYKCNRYYNNKKIHTPGFELEFPDLQSDVFTTRPCMYQVVFVQNYPYFNFNYYIDYLLFKIV